MPSRWSSGQQEDSWRGGFLLAALEMYLKNDMKAKFVFLHDVEAAVGFTSTLMTQEFVGSTTIVPQVRFSDYFKLFANPNLKDLEWYFQAGAVAAYGHISMIKSHYSVAHALDKCIAKMESGRRLSHVRQLSWRRASYEEWKGELAVDSMVADLLRERRIDKEILAAQAADSDDEDDYENF